MGTLYLVRHGQASFGAADYDRLSPLGARQCEALGRYWQSRGQRFDVVLRGTLRRHDESLMAIARELPGLPEASLWPGLNEYDSEAVVATVDGPPLPPAGDPTLAREHFRRLRTGLLAWMAGQAQPQGMPSWADFRGGVVAALEHVLRETAGDVLLVSSGGPISTAVGHVLEAGAPTVVELNLRLRNSAVTEFVFTPKRHALLSFNTLPHLVGEGREAWATYA